eukprot:3495362-Prymnesium_polylepis.1
MPLSTTHVTRGRVVAELCVARRHPACQEGATPLHFAAMHGKASLCRTLLEARADPTARAMRPVTHRLMRCAGGWVGGSPAGMEELFEKATQQWQPANVLV